MFLKQTKACSATAAKEEVDTLSRISELMNKDDN